MYWYIAKDENGRKGMVPGNFLKPLKGSDTLCYVRASMYPTEIGNLIIHVVGPKILNCRG
jgi:hypothetical protein